jgi:lysyl-tRNA synthetase class 1
MDGMRKIPDNVPDRSFTRAASAQAADRRCRTRSAATMPSFGHHNNAMLRRFLDTFGFDYEFASATEYYKAGRFDAILLRAAERYDQIMAVMLPTLGARAAARPIQPVPADLAAERPRALRAAEGGRRRGRHDHLQ